MRKAQAVKREIQEDVVYKSHMVTRLINRSMKDGKRSVAQKQVYGAFERIAEDTGTDPLRVFTAAIENIKPEMEVRPRRVGGAAYQIPMPVRGPRKESLAIRWLVRAAGSRPPSEYKTYAAKLAAEIIDASKGLGGAMQQRQTMEKMAEANRAFSHFRW